MEQQRKEEKFEKLLDKAKWALWEVRRAEDNKKEIEAKINKAIDIAYELAENLEDARISLEVIKREIEDYLIDLRTVKKTNNK